MTTWRIPAKFATTCSVCKGYIKKGAMITQVETSSRWAHAICPQTQRPRSANNQPRLVACHEVEIAFPELETQPTNVDPDSDFRADDHYDVWGPPTPGGMCADVEEPENVF